MSLSAEHGKMLIVMKEIQLPLVQGMESEIIGRYPITDKSISEGGARQNNRTLMKETVFVIMWGAASNELRKTRLLSDKDAPKSGLKKGFGMEF
jgi:hypothetical protein